jgi:RHH-type proline utilization regulon transcriptional repressor/proline dehydrogenase/delta 1-pyrroline-5-carboxylate dehydrogenase
MLESYIEAMRKRARVHQVPAHVAFAQRAGGTFVAPALVEIDRLRELEREVFGPVLHVLRFRREALDDLVDGINALGYGLTLGIHSRVDETIEAVTRRARVGNVYVNRNIIGAVVGVQPFGGEGLSGTGPKAGGPLYLHAFLARTPDDSAVTQLRALGAGAAQSTDEPFAAFARWCEGRSRDLGAFCARLREITPSGICVALPGPTGEQNTYSLLPRGTVLCIASDEGALLAQAAAVLAIGGEVLWPQGAAARALLAALPKPAASRVRLCADWRAPGAEFDAVLHTGDAAQRREVQLALAARPGPIVGVHAFDPARGALHLERLLIERAVSVNTAAAGGNASLMTLG